MADNYRQGDHYIIDDTTGIKVRASETKKQWDGKIVHRSVFEPRHPQDLIRARRDNMAVKDPRPRPVDTFVGPLTTTVAAEALAGDTNITVEDSTRMQPGDQVSILRDDGENEPHTLQSVPDASTIVLNEVLRGKASIGCLIVDTSAVAPEILP